MAKYPYNTTNWQKLRALKLCAQPLCENCEEAGFLVLATVVDHRLAISAGGEPFPPLEGLASLCPRCHNAKTARGPEAGRIRTSKPRKGCTPDGMPIDKWHPWVDKSPLAGSAALAKPSDLRASASPITIIFGPPGAGKTTYAHQNMQSGDKLLDLDIIAAGLHDTSIYRSPRHAVPQALRVRNRELHKLANVKVDYMTWLIVSAPSQHERDWWQSTLRPTSMILLAPPMEETLLRIQRDDRRGEHKPDHIRACYAWYARYQREKIAQNLPHWTARGINL